MLPSSLARPGRSPGPALRFTPRYLLTEDGIRIEAVHAPQTGGPRWPRRGPREPRAHGGVCFVVAHGFTGSWRRPAVRRVAEALGRLGGVVSFDFRGHGRSRGLSTLGALEVLDLDAAVRWARTLGYERVATVGWSLGGSTAVRHAALHSGVDAVVAVSSPSRWDNHDSVEMRRLQWMIQRRLGRVFARGVLRTRISPGGYDPMPAPPVELVGRLAPVPLLVVHGDRDSYLPLHHAEELHAAAGDPRALWIEQGFGHAEAGASDRLVARLGRWAIGALDTALSGTAQPARGGA